jgi:hypothetical protein
MTGDAPNSIPVTLSASAPARRPIACTLEVDAMPERLEYWQGFLAHARARATMPDGRLRIEFDHGVDVADLARLVAAEQQCCGFFDFALTIDGRGIALEIGAPAEAAEIVSSMFGTAS